jgi:hypothetical protein
MARIRIEALGRPTEQELDSQQERGVVGAGPGIRGVYTGVTGSRLPYTWSPGVSTYWGGTSIYYGGFYGGYYGGFPAAIYPWGTYYYQPPVIIEPVQPVIVSPWGW